MRAALTAQFQVAGSMRLSSIRRRCGCVAAGRRLSIFHGRLAVPQPRGLRSYPTVASSREQGGTNLTRLELSVLTRTFHQYGSFYLDGKCPAHTARAIRRFSRLALFVTVVAAEWESCGSIFRCPFYQFRQYENQSPSVEMTICLQILPYLDALFW